MLGKMLKANEDRKNAEIKREEEKARQLKEDQKKEDAQHVATAFDSLKNWLSRSIEKGACANELTVRLSYSSEARYDEVNAGAFYRLLVNQSYAVETLFTSDPVFAPLFTSFKSWCNSEGLDVKWVYKENDYATEEDESSWSMVFSLAN